MIKAMRARYPGRCAATGAPIRPGDDILYDGRTGRATLAAPRAQKALPALQGINRTWFCGSYCGYGFHEDAFKSGLAVAEKLGASVPWGGVLNVTGKPVVVRPAA